MSNSSVEVENLLNQLLEGQTKIMSAITDWATKEQADLTAIQGTLTSIVSGIAALDAQITAFQNSPGTLSATDQAALNAIQSASDALVTQSAAISTTAPSATPPASGGPPTSQSPAPTT